ncbi:hypothetical protein [Lichenifustis flavocetrariae]|uniref:Uncharacterized protein n=1 Tax=Lichenifustis flavocetrariae TaxID=2949735 RepID=A0AA42CQ62_9HYPH|nr:hypothetical protein [Lichenifustis flavocetrariae]MCW6511132.1 hypothetical protein [Lichenifustis flavocetrariae]
MHRVLLSFAILPLIGGGAEAIDSHSPHDLLYADARDVFLHRGYRPFVMPGSDICDESNPRCYPELEFCVHKRRWICTYAWRYEKTVFHVETKSDTPIVDSFYCVLNCTEAGGVKPMPEVPEEREDIEPMAK